ncbi:AAA family ATPase [Gilvimarinus sp. 1_MG-2023]|uniref:AAA family ATPase n=1 Tax=Gilvimarinus sp. 1_MG-2023 TaxID=3062638 RepID=UPI0026E40D9A|nr:AAA family ATPase [Gilvimarinus sp. 1_MG-2023]MDO6747765.1 shikimate kinase [Gilvimarinus sp. 1_MG-2023]
MPRTVIFGNSGSGKSTLAQKIAMQSSYAHLDLDTIAWQPNADSPQRRDLDQSAKDIHAFVRSYTHWVIEGCYSDLLDIAMQAADDIIFLNPGTETCIANAKKRPWEPHKYSSPAAQNANLAMLIDWIKNYSQRTDVFSYRAHRALFTTFAGRKREILSFSYD